MKLSDLLKDIPKKKTVGSLGVNITDIASDSRQVRRDGLFVAVKGVNADGFDFISDAIKRQAAAIISDRMFHSKGQITKIIVDSAQEVLPHIASKYYGNSGEKLKLIGITGTNGKTTTSFLIHSILEHANIKSGLLGTVDYIIGKRIIPAPLTTPDIISTNKYLAQMLENNCEACVMEVSSHALDQGRVNGLPFDGAVFTNLGRDHMDYHNSVKEYLSAKTKLFKSLSQEGFALINLDDSNCNAVMDNTLAKIIGYGIKNVHSSNVNLKIQARAVKMTDYGMSFSVDAPLFGNRFDLQTSLIGLHNVYNILAAIGVGLNYGFSIDVIKEGIAAVRNVPGRLQKIDLRQPFKIFIDYAHTPDALECILNAVREITERKIILVFGCGGSRDKQKRPLMGRIASQYADYVIITTDNPRKENPKDIINDIKEGIISDNYDEIIDRKEAIITALKKAQLGDSVIIAGKGHENYQILKDTVVSFNDSHVVKEFITANECYIN